MTAVETLASAPATSCADDITHIMCCVDEDLSLCGRDVSDMTEDERRDVLCVPCGLAETNGDECPKYGRCVEDQAVLS